MTKLIGHCFSTAPQTEVSASNRQSMNKRIRNSLVVFSGIVVALLGYDGWFAYCNRRLLLKDPVLDITIWKQFGPEVYNIAVQLPEVQSRYGTKNKFIAQQLRVVEKGSNIKFFTCDWTGGFYGLKFRIYEYVGHVRVSMPLNTQGSPTLNIVAKTTDGRWTLERAYFEEPNNLCINIPVPRTLFSAKKL
jgi:hypothetical protein